jgi:hypothetical protein
MFEHKCVVQISKLPLNEFSKRTHMIAIARGDTVIIVSPLGYSYHGILSEIYV